MRSRGNDDEVLVEREKSEFLASYAIDQLESTPRSAGEYARNFPRIAAWIANEIGDATKSKASAFGDFDAGRELLNTTVGNYKILSELGRGGQGVVYLAQDVRLQRRVALKVLTETWSLFSGETRARFQREAATLAKLQHPGICTLYDAGTARDASGIPIAYIAMRYLEGETLAKVLSEKRREGRKPPSERPEILQIAEVVEQTARAIHTAHEAGIHHRDLKPGNIMITKNAGPVVLDFGLAREEDNSILPMTRTGDFIGTPAYMAPEQLDPRLGRVDARADVWALGATLFECLTLIRPFDGPTRDAIVQKVLRGDSPDARRANRRIPRDLSIILQTALEREPARRYRSALEFAEDLKCFREHEPIAARAAGPILRLRRWTQRQPALAASLGGLLFVLLTGLSGVSLLYLKSQSALADLGRLSDARILRDLLEREQLLYPEIPERVGGSGGFDAWIAEARALLGREDDHQSSLKRVAAQLQSFRADGRGGREENGRTLAWWNEQLTQLVADLGKFPETVKRVEARRNFAAEVDLLSIENYKSEWTAAIDAIRRDPKYNGLIMKPRRGLVPAGRDPVSGLYEFSHLETGAVAARDATTKLLNMNGACGIVFILLPGRTVRIGADAPTESRPAGSPHVDGELEKWEGPSGEIALDPFFISKYEMTQGQWSRFCGANPSDRLPGGPGVDTKDPLRHPVEQISWNDCNQTMSRLGLMLPTEAQWEYAARGGTTTPYWAGQSALALNGKENIADRYAKENGGGANWRYQLDFYDGWLATAPVGSFGANGFGFYDIGGNVQEWIRETWEDYSDHPARPGDGFRNGDFRYRVVRGGDFSSGISFMRVARRSGLPPTARMPTAGVRPARALDR